METYFMVVQARRKVVHARRKATKTKVRFAESRVAMTEREAAVMAEDAAKAAFGPGWNILVEVVSDAYYSMILRVKEKEYEIYFGKGG